MLPFTFLSFHFLFSIFYFLFWSTRYLIRMPSELDNGSMLKSIPIWTSRNFSWSIIQALAKQLDIPYLKLLKVLWSIPLLSCIAFTYPLSEWNCCLLNATNCFCLVNISILLWKVINKTLQLQSKIQNGLNLLIRLKSRKVLCLFKPFQWIINLSSFLFVHFWIQSWIL